MIAELFRLNCSTLFLLKPTIGINFQELKKGFGLVNSYLRDKAREDLEGNLLFVLFKPIDFDYFEMFLEEQAEKAENFIEDYDYAGGYVVIVYRIPEILKPDFELFKQGKYSKFSKLLKNCYEREIKTFLTPSKSFQWGVFNKEEWLKERLEEFLGEHFTKEMEFWSIPDIEGHELLDIDNFIKPDGNGEIFSNSEGYTESV